MIPVCSRPSRFMPALGLICAGLLASCRPPPPSYEGYGYLIIVPEAVSFAVEELADYKRSRGFLVETVLLEDILAQAPGGYVREKIRNYLAEYSATTPQPEFVLLAGSWMGIPTTAAYVDTEHLDIVFTDFYYEDAIGDWNPDGDEYLGEYGDDMAQGTYDYEAELRIGRIPSDDPEAIAAACDAFIRFDQDPSPRMLRAMTASEGSFFSSECETALGMRMTEELMLGPAGYSTTRLYNDCPALEPDYELTMENFLAQWEQREPAFVTWIAHASTSGTSFLDSDNLPQGVAPAVGAAVSCSICQPLFPSSLGRRLVETGTCASLLCATEVAAHGADPFPVLLAGFDASASLVTDRLAVGDAKARFIESFVRRERVPQNMSGGDFHRNIFGLIVFGDPSLQLR